MKRFGLGTRERGSASPARCSIHFSDWPERSASPSATGKDERRRAEASQSKTGRLGDMGRSEALRSGLLGRSASVGWGGRLFAGGYWLLSNPPAPAGFFTAEGNASLWNGAGRGDAGEERSASVGWDSGPLGGSASRWETARRWGWKFILCRRANAVAPHGGERECGPGPGYRGGLGCRGRSEG